MGEVIPFPNHNAQQVQGGQIAQAIDSQIIESTSVRKRLKTTVSQLAILAPSIFMKPEDPEKMVQMLYEERAEIIESKTLKPLIQQVQEDVANTNQVPVSEQKQAA